MDKSPELQQPPQDQPKPRTLEDVVASTTIEQVTAALTMFHQQYVAAKKLAILANPPSNPQELALDQMTGLSYLELKLEAIVDEIQSMDPIRDHRIAIRLCNKLKAQIDSLPKITVAPPGARVPPKGNGKGQ